MRTQAALAATLLLAAAPGPTYVTQHHRSFAPDTVAITRGDTLHFRNEDPFPHQILIKSEHFTVDSDLQPTGQDLDVTFPLPGTFEVRCGVHPRMRLTVTVR